MGLDLIKDFGIAVPDSKALVISMKSGAQEGALDFQSVQTQLGCPEQNLPCSLRECWNT